MVLSFSPLFGISSESCAQWGEGIVVKGSHTRREESFYRGPQDLKINRGEAADQKPWQKRILFETAVSRVGEHAPGVWEENTRMTISNPLIYVSTRVCICILSLAWLIS